MHHCRPLKDKSRDGASTRSDPPESDRGSASYGGRMPFLPYWSPPTAGAPNCGPHIPHQAAWPEGATHSLSAFSLACDP